MAIGTPLESCPRCRAAMEQGFCHRAIGLSFVAPSKLARFVSIDEDLARSGLRKFLPSKAEYYRSSLCRACGLYVIDYGTTLSSTEAKEAAARLTGKSDETAHG